MKSYPLIIALAFATSATSFAQNRTTTLLKNDGRRVDQIDSADFVRVVSAPDSGSQLFNVNEYYKDKTQKMTGKSWSANSLQFEGPVVWFYPSGTKQEMSNFHEGRKKGDSYEYYPNGKLYTHIKYLGPNEKIGDIDQLFLDEQDSTGTAVVTDGNGYLKLYNNNFANVLEEGKVVNGLRDGNWKGDNGSKDHRITFTETYEHGILKSGKSEHAYENKTYEYTSRGMPPEFPGGIPAFSAFLGQNIHYPPALQANKVQGRVIATFVVQPDGKLSEIKIVRSPAPEMSAEAVRVLSLSPAWIPGHQYGKAVRVSYTVPINFSL